MSKNRNSSMPQKEVKKQQQQQQNKEEEKQGKNGKKPERAKSAKKIKVDSQPIQKKKLKTNHFVSVDGFDALGFYLSTQKLKLSGTNIDTILEEWSGNYDKIDQNLEFTNWIFPTFNDKNGKEHSKEFRKNIQVAKKIVKIYEMITDYYGWTLDDDQSGDLSKKEDCKKRYEKTFLKPLNTHSFRIRRMLQFLTITGFRRYAIKLVDLLREEVLGKNLKNTSIVSQVGAIKKVVELPPLYHYKEEYEQEWKLFGQFDEKDKAAVELLSKKCSKHSLEDLNTNSVFFDD